MIDFPCNHPVLPGLFDPYIPNNPALWAVLQGRHAGRAYVDDLQRPKQCVLRTEAQLTYASRNISPEFLSEVIEYLRTTQCIWLIRAQGDPTAPKGYQIIPRLEFYDNDIHSHRLGDLRGQLPDGHEIRRIDRNLLDRCEWRDDMAFYCGSLENFLRHGVGLCLMHGDEILVEAYASALGDPMAEIGAITHEPYRGRGYATITVAFLIEALEQRGYQPYWSCDLDNPASVHVARKLGFRFEKPYEIWEYKSQAE
jgi:RimJ/RimL family protein N-acetyltransferase